MANGIAPEGRLPYRGIVFLFAILAAFGIGLLLLRNPRALPEVKAADTMNRLAARPVRADMVILALDDASVKKYGAVKSWPRSLLASGLRRVEDGKPKLVVFDLALDKRTHTGDADLWREMANNRNVVLGMGYNGERSQTYTPDDIRSLVFLEKDAMADRLVFTEKTPEFAYQFFEPPVSDFTGSSRGVGVFDRETDNDGVVRHARLFYRSEVTYPQTANGRLPKNFGNAKLNDGAPVALPNLALISSVGTFDIDKWDVSVLNSEISMGGSIRPHVDIPIDDQGRMLIRYSPAGAQQQVSFADVMSGKVKSDFFRDKTVLIGATADGDEATDARVTPVGTRIPRVEITANAISTILDRSYVGWYDHKALGITIFVGLIAGLMLMLVSGARATALTLALMLGWLVVCYFAFSVGHLILPVISGLLIILIPYVVGLALALGPFRPEPVPVSPTYVPPPPGAVRNV